MRIFVVNCGSSSIKYRLIEMPQAILVCSGLVDRIGFPNSTLLHHSYKNGEEIVVSKNLGEVTHASALAAVVAQMMDKETGVIQSPDEIDIVGHRVLHGGDVFSKTVFINEAVKTQLKKLFPLGPLHLPANYMGIEVAEKLFTKAKQVAVFDTAFHQTMPPVAYRYAIDNKYYLENGVRAYGFHGTSHKYVSEKAMAYLHRPDAKIITIHLGNGCSMAAINAGKCMDTSMGLGPLSGMVMGTRCGDIDPSVIFHLMHQTGISVAELQDILNKKSGMLGLCGLSDMRDIKAAIGKGEANALLAYELYAYRVKKYIGSYVAVLNGVDAIVFTGGIGENDAEMRALCLENLSFLGIVYDHNRNEKKQDGIMECQASTSLVKILVIPTNEELEIANQCYELANE